MKYLGAPPVLAPAPRAAAVAAAAAAVLICAPCSCESCESIHRAATTARPRPPASAAGQCDTRHQRSGHLANRWVSRRGEWPRPHAPYTMARISSRSAVKSTAGSV
jgi:hypothetical protein